MLKLSEEQFKSWLDSLGKAWVETDPELAVSLFDDEAEYHNTPFKKPMVGRDAIFSYWKSGTDAQKDIKFEFQILATKDNYGIAHAWGSMVQDGKPQKWDGIFWAIFNDTGKCLIFKEFWSSQ